MKPLIAALALIVLVVLPAAAQAPETPETPRVVVDELHSGLLATLQQADILTPQERFDLLHESVSAAYHMDVMIRTILGGRWLEATEDQRRDLVAAFRDFSVALYASRLKTYNGQVFTTFAAVDGPRGTKLVPARITRPRKDPADLTYVLRRTGDGWGIVDVITGGGISELAVRRSEYAGILRRSGVEGLTAALRAKVRSLLSV